MFFHQRLARRKEKETVRAGRRVPSRSEGAAPPSVSSPALSFTLPGILPFVQPTALPCHDNMDSPDAALPFDDEVIAMDDLILFSPLTSRGVTIPKESETNINENPHSKTLGGYDGGVEVGFNGEWSPLKFKTLLQTLESAKTAAENECSDERFVTLGDSAFSVHAHGANCGAHYKFVMEGNGVKFYIHANPRGPIQAIRLRYGYEALAGRDLFAVHANTLDWLKEIGFTVQKETVSRVDLQVMLLRSIAELIAPIFENRAVKLARDSKIHMKGNQGVTSFTAGTRIQLCIYDKRRELIDTCDEVKMSLLVNDCLDGEFPDELTRIEFRLRRDALKYFGINTIQDLLEREHALVDYLTFDWFRILNDEKDRSNSALQELDPVWQEVRDLFFEYFPGPVENRKPIDRNTPGRREIKCTGNSLIKQAVGCLATAAALAKGVFETECQALAFVADVVGEKVKTLCNRVRERVIELGIVRGVEPPDAIDWHLDPRYASDSAEAVIYEFRAVFDEDVQYERVRNFAVAGCPF
ncbi:MAG: hypothetical protein FWH27_18465 [Planctomycetaceae bacterium]|nr:hypothetical protein [Planctomycetaceae bacterium]